MEAFWQFWVDGFYAPFALPAYAVLAARIWAQTISRREWLVVAVFFGHHLLQVAQLWVGDGVLNSLTDRTRYFYPLAPLLWLWTAYGVWRLWELRGRWRTALRVALACVGAALFVYEIPVRTARQVLHGSRSETRRAGECFAPIIRADYKGPATFKDFKRDPDHYFVNRRPLLGPDWDNGAWPLRTQSLWLGALQPYPDYYLSFKPPPPELAGRYTLIATKKLRRRTFYLYRLNPEPAP